MSDRAALLRAAFDAAVAAARPERWLAGELALVPPPAGVLRVLAIGKAAGPMARAAVARLAVPCEGLAIVPADDQGPISGFRVMVGSHPVPDAASLAAGEAALVFAARTGPDDRLLVLLSGGASAMASAPIDGVPLAVKADLTRALLASGADIAEINTVRRALSRLKGGGLARASHGPVLTLAMSDVPDDALYDIGSGPAAASPTGVEEALAVLRRRAPTFLSALEAPLRAHAERLGPTPPVEARVAFRPADALAAAAAVLKGAGWPVTDLGMASGEAREVAAAHALLAGAGRRQAFLSGGELSVRLGGGPCGRGGRNLEYLLALAIALRERRDVWALAADTDGRDGSAPAAGAWLDPGLTAALDPAEARAALEAHDAFAFFRRHGRLVETGPTGVNVGDPRLMLVEAGTVA